MRFDAFSRTSNMYDVTADGQHFVVVQLVVSSRRARTSRVRYPYQLSEHLPTVKVSHRNRWLLKSSEVVYWRGGLMDTLAIFGLQLVLSPIVYTLIAKWYVTPWLAEKPIHHALMPLIFPHALRHLGLTFFVSGVVAQPLPSFLPTLLGTVAFATNEAQARESTCAGSRCGHLGFRRTRPGQRRSIYEAC